MQIGYFEPLNLAWERMKHILWRPFDLAKWLVLGFSVWLAGLADSAGGGGWKWVFDEGDFPRSPIGNSHGYSSWQDAGEAMMWLPLLFVLIMAVAAILLVILWVSSRAKFIFLDNVGPQPSPDRRTVASPAGPRQFALPVAVGLYRLHGSRGSRAAVALFCTSGHILLLRRPCGSVLRGHGFRRSGDDRLRDPGGVRGALSRRIRRTDHVQVRNQVHRGVALFSAVAEKQAAPVLPLRSVRSRTRPLLRGLLRHDLRAHMLSWSLCPTWGRSSCCRSG